MIEANDDAGTQFMGPPAMTERGAATIKTGAALRPPRRILRRAVSAACRASAVPLVSAGGGRFALCFMV